LILEAINKYNTSLGQGDRGERGVPVPEVYALCMDKEVVGAGFYVMEFLEGRVFQNIFMKEVNDEDRRAWCVVPLHPLPLSPSLLHLFMVVVQTEWARVQSE
jgi:hypothetical protein